MKENSDSRKWRRHYYRETERKCRGRGSHADALVLVEYILNSGGRTNLTMDQLAQELGWEQRVGSARVTDLKRLQIARNHVKDGLAKDGKPCTGFRLHYRTSARENEWMLIDPSGGADHQMEIALREIQGDLQQHVAFRTVNGRRASAAHAAAEMFLKAGNTEGYQRMTSLAMEYERFGAPSDQTIAELNLWLASEL